MAAIPAGFPRSANLEGVIVEAIQALNAAQDTALTTNPNLEPVLDTFVSDSRSSVFRFGGQFKITTSINATTGKLEITAISSF